MVLNLKKLSIPKSQWKILAKTIEKKLTHQQSFFQQDPEIEALAENFSALIIQKKMNVAKQNSKEKVKLSKKQAQTSDSNVKNVCLDSFSHSSARSFGGENLVHHVMQDYKLDTIFDQIGMTDKQKQACKMLIAGRMLHPSSERETARWLNHNSSLPEILGADTIYDSALHRAAVKLYSQHEIIEDYLSDKSRQLFNLQETIILYDLTNTYFEGSKRKSEKAKRGRSKEKRNDCPLMSLALTIDSEGFPKRSHVYEGNVSEPSTLKDILQKVSFGTENRQTIVMDTGISRERILN